MITFLIQTGEKDNQIMYDFGFHLKEAIDYNNWFYNERVYSYEFCNKHKKELISNIRETIPVGSIEFVLSFYREFLGIKNIKPINIPIELQAKQYLHRKILNLNEARKDQIVFAKSRDKFKDYTEISPVKDLPKDKDLIISEYVDILSEWRAFVFRGELLDIRNYSGDFRCVPDINVVESMIKSYKNSPIAYTIDVGVLNKEGNRPTALIEVHEFFSCGLYGFREYKLLPRMFIETHKELLKRL